jgi:AraC-like DNA-binding protein
MVVRLEFVKLGIEPVAVELGEVELKNELDATERKKVTLALQELGFDLIDDKKSRLIERVKNLIIELVQENHNELKTNLSDYLTSHLHNDYHYLSNLFSAVEGTTIEKYFIAQKIEKVKELLVYDELSLSEIADQLNYSSVAYLSSQFKRVTGLTPSHFKNIKSIRRKPLDEV